MARWINASETLNGFKDELGASAAEVMIVHRPTCQVAACALLYASRAAQRRPVWRATAGVPEARSVCGCCQKQGGRSASCPSVENLFLPSQPPLHVVRIGADAIALPNTVSISVIRVA